uniref:Glutathione S-transferase kappa 1 n=1 Tax=Sinocyclocheilus anshuiensis TaxID=1608454 RepID=A0A671RGD0_9TELE
MSNSRKVVKLYCDVISTYSWLAFEVLCRYRNFWNIDLKFKPAFLGGVFHGSGNQKPGLVQNKFCYMVTDLKQLSDGYLGLSHLFFFLSNQGTLNVMRFVTAVDEKEKESGVLVERVSRELWKNIWCTHQDITHPAGLKAGLSANEVEELLIPSKSQQIKDKLKNVTQVALDYQVSAFHLLWILTAPVLHVRKWLTLNHLQYLNCNWGLNTFGKNAGLG